MKHCLDDLIQKAWSHYKKCFLCEHKCGINRLSSEVGVCGAGKSANCFLTMVSYSDELEFIPSFEICLSGCNLHCVFCNNAVYSQDASKGSPINTEITAQQAQEAVAQGAKTVQILGGEPTIHLPVVLEIVKKLPQEIPVIWNSNMYCSLETMELISGVFAVTLADFKFGNNTCALKYAGIKNYVEIIKRNLLLADKNSRLVVRHLLLPNHLDCCFKPVIEWLSSSLPSVELSLFHQYIPLYQAREYPEIADSVDSETYQRAIDIAAGYGITSIIPHIVKKELQTSNLNGNAEVSSSDAVSEIYINSQGKVFVKNVTKDIIEVLHKVAPEDKDILNRLDAAADTKDENPQ